MKRVALAVAGIVFVVLFHPTNVEAVTSWSLRSLTESPGFVADPDCPAQRVPVTVTGGQDYEMACLFQGSRVSLAVITDEYGQRRAQLLHVFGEGVYVGPDVCAQGCIYSVSAGKVLQREVQDGKYAAVLREPTGGEGPRFPVVDRSNRALAVGRLAVSSNGDWAAVELINSGVGLLNIADGTFKRVIADGPAYGRGFDPSMEFAVSDTGQFVAMAGENAGWRAVKVTPACGDVPSVSYQASWSEGATPCEELPVAPLNVLPSVRFVSQPRFYGESRMDVKIIAGGKAYAATFSNGEVQAGPDYIALGDSYVSGEGETGVEFFRPRTDRYPETCHVSERSYPFLLGRNAENVACAGARLGDIVALQDYWGQADRVLALGLDEDGRSQYGRSSLSSFHPGIVPQVAFLEAWLPDVVTVGIGGNDAGFMDKLKSCVMPTECEWADDIEKRAAVAQEIGGLFSRLISTFIELRERVAGRVMVVSYPQIIQQDKECTPLMGLLLSKNERRFIWESIVYLNDVIEAAARVARVEFVDIEDSLEGERLCQSSKAIHGLLYGDDIAPLSSLPLLKLISAGTFHPTPYGHQRIGTKVRETLMHGPSVITVSASPPAPGSYWDEGGARRHLVAFSGASIANDSFVITLPIGSLEPASLVDIWLYSSPRYVGSGRAGADGGLSLTLKAPKDVEGFHTLHLYGTSLFGGSVDIYQTLAFGHTLSTSSSTTARDVPPAPDAAVAAAPRGTLGVVQVVSPTSNSHNSPLSDASDAPLPDRFVPWIWLGVAVAVFTSGLVFAWHRWKDRGG